VNDRIIQQKELEDIRLRLDTMILHLESAAKDYPVDVNVNYGLFAARELRKQL
jgi:hypothetical protein